MRTPVSSTQKTGTNETDTARPAIRRQTLENCRREDAPARLLRACSDRNATRRPGIFGYLDEEALTFLAGALSVPPSKVYGVATFYNFFSLKPQGVHTCVVCLGMACYVKCADKVLAAAEKYCGIKSGETTPDKQLSLLTARCIGACAIGPPPRPWYLR